MKQPEQKPIFASQLEEIKKTAMHTKNIKQDINKRRIYSSIEKDYTVYHLGDICGFSTSDAPGKVRFVGQLLDIWTVKNIPRLVGLDIRWYYSKLDLPDKLKNLPFISHSEVFPSNLQTSIYGEHLISKIDLIDEKKAIEVESISKNQRMSRATYDRKTCKFEPDIEQWQKLCACNQPFCIQAVYVQCSDCNSWFHNRKPCTGMQPEDVNKVTDFFCKECRKKLRTINSRKKR